MPRPPRTGTMTDERVRRDTGRGAFRRRSGGDGMSRFIGVVLTAAVLAGALTLAYTSGAPASLLLGAAAGVLSLLWLLLLLTVPWNLYFRAHSVLAEIGVSRSKGAYFGQLRRRLGTLLKDVTFPRDDVLELRESVARLHAGTMALEEKAEEQYRALAELRRTMDALNVSAHGRADDADRRIAALAREFESTVNRLTDNQEIISGLKAFLRLLRTADDAS